MLLARQSQATLSWLLRRAASFALSARAPAGYSLNLFQTRLSSARSSRHKVSELIKKSNEAIRRSKTLVKRSAEIRKEPRPSFDGLLAAPLNSGPTTEAPKMKFLLPPILAVRRGVPRCVSLHHHPSKKDLPRFDLTFKPPAYHFERHRSSVALSGSITQVRKQWLDTPDTKQGAIAIRGAYSTSCIPSAISGSKLNLLNLRWPAKSEYDLQTLPRLHT